MRFVSFFSGIGGFDLGLERAGHECVGQIEIDPYALQVLERHWPDVPRFGDVRTLDADALPDADLWCAGAPCQRFSSAARGRNTADDLWPAWLYLVGARRPRWLMLENVAQFRQRGYAADTERALQCLSYAVRSAVLDASDFGAPFKGTRYYAVAEANGHSESKLRLDAEVAVVPPLRRDVRPWPDPPRSLRVDDGIPHRTHRLRCLGNAVVPQVVEAIARRVWPCDAPTS